MKIQLKTFQKTSLNHYLAVHLDIRISETKKKSEQPKPLSQIRNASNKDSGCVSLHLTRAPTRVNPHKNSFHHVVVVSALNSGLFFWCDVFPLPE